MTIHTVVHTVLVVDLGTGSFSCRWKPDISPFVPTRLLPVGGEDGALRMWSLRSGRLLHTGASLPGPVTSMRRPRYTGE